MLDTNKINELIDIALKARLNAYAPYSKYRVGAAVLTEKGIIYSGCNVENASYGLTNCAERTAIFKAVSRDDTKIVAVAVVTDSLDSFVAPCGACRQIINEFNPNTTVIMSNLKKNYKVISISELLPFAFGPDNLA